MRSMKRQVMAWLLATALSVGMCMPAGAVDSNDTVRLLNDYEKVAVYTNMSNLIPFQGLYRQTIQVEDTERELVVYLPEQTRKNEYFVTIALPSECNIYSFLETSGWIEIAEENNCGLRVLVPQNGQWGSFEEELAYIDSARYAGGFSFFGGFYYTTYGFEYLFGVGDGGALLERWAASNAMQVISQVFINTGVTADTLSAQTEGITYQSDLSMKDHPNAHLSGAYNPVPLSEIPIPTWLIGSEQSADYWKNVNDCTSSAQQIDVSVKLSVFWQDKGKSNAIATSYSDVLSQVRISDQADYTNPALVKDAYEFLSGYTRGGGDSVYSNVLGNRLDYAEAKADGRLYEVFDYVQTVDNSGNADAKTASTDWMRNYIVYVPEQCKDYKQTQYPVVYFFSDGSTPSHAYLDQTHAWEVADRYGVIIVVPSSVDGWNLQDGSWPVTVDPITGSISDDIDFVDKLFTTIEEDFNVDQGRVYITGLSMGGIFCNYLGMQLGDRITAVGLTSGPIFGAELYNEDHSVGTGMQYLENATDNILPTMIVMGEQDNWPVYVGPWEDSLANQWYAGQMNSTNPSRFNDVFYSYSTQNYWLTRNGLPLDGYRIIEKGLTINGQNCTPVEYTAETAAQRYTTYEWENQEGIPLFSWCQCAGRAHITAISDYEKVWTDWFAHYRMSADGTRYYSASAFAQDDEVVIAAVPTIPFADVDSNAWYYDAVRFVYEKNLMEGDSSDSFTPDKTISRAHMWVTLARIDGVEPDTAGDPWYQEGMNWAISKDLTDGSNPYQQITREEIAEMMFKILGEPTVHGDLSAFADSNSVTNQAAMSWAVGSGLLKGNGDGTLDPSGIATRAEVAAMLMRYVQDAQ